MPNPVLIPPHTYTLYVYLYKKKLKIYGNDFKFGNRKRKSIIIFLLHKTDWYPKYAPKSYIVYVGLTKLWIFTTRAARRMTRCRDPLG